MASIKVLLYKSNPKSDGTFPSVIRVIQNRKTAYHQIGYSVKENEWNAKEGIVKKTYANSTRLNFLIGKKNQRCPKYCSLQNRRTSSSPLHY